MNTPLPTHLLAQGEFDLALAALRQSPAQDGSLWQGLLVALGATEAALSATLLEGHGIAVIDDAQWPGVKPGSTAAGGTADLCIRVMLDGKTLLLCEDPWSAEATRALARSTQAHRQLALARPGQIAFLKKQQKSAVPARPADAATPASLNDASPVVQFVDQAIAKAYEEGASDIHFEKDRKGVGIKYRLDGVMAPGERLDDPQRAEEVISRIKVLAQLDITERRRPQDGRIHWQQKNGDSIDLRVSIMPSIFGEDAVLRLLDKAQLRHTEESMSLDVLGFDAAVAATIRALATRPHGMLLITGPTGSGKTTTVYAALSEANDGLEKIVTIEDPVEYELPGVLQIPVNEQKGLTFATGLRSILRHDPDKILVGEIRDAETAEIAIQSSLTGHLVFTTVHANSLFDVLGRFQHFGIDPFALASALNGVVVQRLLRKLCPHCVQWKDTTAAERDKLCALGLPVPAQLPKAQGCAHCRQTGYRGRFVVAEVHELTDAVRDLIVRKTSMTELKETVYRDASTRLLAQAVARVEQGTTTLEEVARVVGLV
ncbi:type II secretory pathway, ATPase PulE/Tfp pilus assembly pathway, ATPase PilB [Polaromonas sp. CF318]|uniref:GspE/PulE family protein n=1 Tax=Polaromonas sp. CF318 TaxID=1144318 RepID=UPI0002714C37|nr:GspE/PulE family protein [Polaromonas sp. CF318]EJL85514.1 type II secretory pathway, ATPase PulE/Tfp pilus assembly pathway, ATPase PilB [Polaromonas sp. CF318]